MHWIADKLVSDDILEAHFACELSACKGACCWEGEFGAPLEEAELELMTRIGRQLSPELPEESRELLRTTGAYVWYDDMEKYGTSLRADGACVFLTFTEEGIGVCAIEKAWREGRTDVQKPISCHLYPIRATFHESTGMTSLNYDRWSICSAACQKGARERILLFRFAEAAIRRAFGDSFYEALENAAERLHQGGAKSPE